jgi:hypothetical protein
MAPQIRPVHNRSQWAEAQNDTTFAIESITIGKLIRIRILTLGSSSDENPRKIGNRIVPRKNPK